MKNKVLNSPAFAQQGNGHGERDDPRFHSPLGRPHLDSHCEGHVAPHWCSSPRLGSNPPPTDSLKVTQAG